MKVALFARYSSKMQDEMSLDAQLSEMRTFVSRQPGWEITREFYLPETPSAHIAESEPFQAMMAAAKRKEFNILLLHKLDRFGRDREHAIIYKSKLKRMGVKVKSVVENFGDGIMDRTMEGMLEVISAHYSANLGEETKKGHKQLVRSGYWTGGKVPWGLTTVPVSEGKSTHQAYAAHPVNGPILAEMFQKVADGVRTGLVLNWLEKETGERWSAPSLYTRLRNPIYHGLVQYGHTKMQAGYPREKLDPAEVTSGSWAGVITKELFDRANSRFGGPTNKGGRMAEHHEYLLSEGVAICSRCGRNLVGSRHGKESRYVCAGRRDKKCVQATVSALKLEDSFAEKVSHMLTEVSVDQLVKTYEESLEPEREAARKREARLRARLNEIKATNQNLLEAIEAGGGAIPTLVRRMKDLQTEEGDIAEALATCALDAEQALALNVQIVAEYLRDIYAKMKGADPADLKEVYRGLFRVEFDLETKKGQLQMKLAPSGSQEMSLDSPCISNGRSARTIRYTKDKASRFTGVAPICLF